MLIIIEANKILGVLVMADMRSFPSLSSNCWWKLREKFRSAPPRSQVTEEYLSSVLGMKMESIKNNGIISNLKLLQLLDDDSKCTDKANRWRMDDTYSAVCKEIMETVYPNDLLDIGSDSSVDRIAVYNWFMTKTGAGTSFANKLTGMYMLLAKADVTEQQSKNNGTTEKMTKSTLQKSKKNNVEKPVANVTAPATEPQIATSSPAFSLPAINMNLQVHISSDATVEQIDQIFASMAKHLYNRV